MGPAADTSRLLASPSSSRGFPAPTHFRPALTVDWAYPTEDVPEYLTRPRRYTGRRGQGVRYERKVQEYLGELAGGAGGPNLPEAYIPSQWWRFGVEGHARWCQTDGLLLRPREGQAIIYEVKYQHTADAWFQLRELYEPVVREALGPAWELAFVEVVKWYDPATFFPERVLMYPDPLRAQAGRIGVHIWTP
jgi:hypothetical protein